VFLRGLREGIKGQVKSFYALGSMSHSWMMNVMRAVEIEFRGKGKMVLGKFVNKGEGE